jgi:tetratricopeptide (TPR) repeat protein/transcriptional regulator with XRE-family HTH domain
MATPQLLALGQLLRRYRDAARLTQAQLAARSGVSARTISDLERGLLRTPYRHTIDSLATALELTLPERTHFEAAVRQQSSPQFATPRHTSPGQSRGVVTSLVGRAHELGVLERHLSGQEPPVLLLAGEPGIGKTRLLRETALLARDQGWMVLEGGCQRSGGQGPYAPVVEALARQLAQQTPTQQRADLLGCAWLVRLLPELSEVLIAPIGTPPREDERRLMFAAARRYLANVAGPAGTLLVLDDLQWAGSDGLDLLAALLQVEAERPLRVVGAYRSTEIGASDPLGGLVADLARDGHIQQIPLGPLAQAEARQLLSNLLTDTVLPTAIQADRLVQFTGGVPFFLVSCLQGLHTGALAAEAEETATPGVPWNVAQTIHQRVAALPAAAQELLDVAAVMGRMVPGALLARALGKPDDVVLEGLEAACQARLLVEHDVDTYHFAHDLIHEVVAGALSSRRRKILHQRVAVALEAEPGESALELLAYHYLRSDAREQTIVYLERAGDQAETQYAAAAAEGYYRELVALLERLGRAIDAARAREKLSRVLHAMGRYTVELEVLAHATAAYRAAGDLEGEARSVLAAALTQVRAGAPREVLRLLRPLQEEPFVSSLSLRAQALLQVRLQDVLIATGQVNEALQASERAVAVAQSVGSLDLLIHTQIGYGLTLSAVARLDEAISVFERALPVAQRMGDAAAITRVLLNIGSCCVLQGMVARGREALDRGVVVGERAGDTKLLALLALTLGEIAYVVGKWGQAQTYLRRAMEALRQIGSPSAVLYLPISLGRLALAQGRVEEARGHLAKCLGLAQRNGVLAAVRQAQSLLAELEVVAGRPEAACERLDPLLAGPEEETYDTWALRPVLAWAHLELGEEARAEALLGQALATSRAAGLRLVLVDALRVQGLLATRRGLGEEAQAVLDEALGLCRAIPYPYAEAKALYVYGQMRQAKGEPERACERYEQARAICDGLGEGLYRPQIDRALAALG